MNRLPKKVIGQVGRCIYCGDSSGPLSKEHPIPFGLNGPWVLLKASCVKHAAVTSTFEGRIQRESLMPVRARLDTPTRRPKNRPNKYSLSILTPGQEEVIDVPIRDHLAPLILPIYKPPACLDKRAYSSGMQVIGLCGATLGLSEALLQLHGNKPLKASVKFHGNDFGRLLAKIGYCFAVAYLGMDNLKEVYVLPTILGEKDEAGRWVGCGTPILPATKHLHTVRLEVLRGKIIVRVRLFAALNMPEYLVVVGSG